jgi:hypothetical protein
LTAREQEIGPIYHQVANFEPIPCFARAFRAILVKVATHFADLHDTTSRMREKGYAGVSTDGMVAYYWSQSYLENSGVEDFKRVFILETET